MSQLVPLDQVQLPAHLVGRQVTNASFLAGLPQGGGFPMIGLKGTRFVAKADGGETVLPTVEISVVLIDAKPNLDKAYYATKYDPNSTEAKSPDCFSRDGLYPDPSATLKQHASCAGCPMNQYGSGTDAAGNPGKGKACADNKMLAIFANNGVYGFKLPPASLKAFANYAKETARRGIDLSTCITVIGFDPSFTYPVLTFNFGGFLAPEQIAKIDEMKKSAAVQDIVGNVVAAAPAPKAIEVSNPSPAPAIVASPFDAPPATEGKPATRSSRAAKPTAAPVEVLPPQAPLAEGDDLSSLAASLGVNL